MAISLFSEYLSSLSHLSVFRSLPVDWRSQQRWWRWRHGIGWRLNRDRAGVVILSSRFRDSNRDRGRQPQWEPGELAPSLASLPWRSRSDDPPMTCDGQSSWLTSLSDLHHRNSATIVRSGHDHDNNDVTLWSCLLRQRSTRNDKQPPPNGDNFLSSNGCLQ